MRQRTDRICSKLPGTWAGGAAVAPARSAGLRAWPAGAWRGRGRPAAPAVGRGWSCPWRRHRPWARRPAAPYRARAEWPRGAGALPPAGGGRTGRGDRPGRGGRCFSFTFPPSEAGALEARSGGGGRGVGTRLAGERLRGRNSGRPRAARPSLRRELERHPQAPAVADPAWSRGSPLGAGVGVASPSLGASRSRGALGGRRGRQAPDPDRGGASSSAQPRPGPSGASAEPGPAHLPGGRGDSCSDRPGQWLPGSAEDAEKFPPAPAESLPALASFNRRGDRALWLTILKASLGRDCACPLSEDFLRLWSFVANL